VAKPETGPTRGICRGRGEPAEAGGAATNGLPGPVLLLVGFRSCTYDRRLNTLFIPAHSYGLHRRCLRGTESLLLTIRIPIEREALGAGP
jgi:hypothetical protein